MYLATGAPAQAGSPIPSGARSSMVRTPVSKVTTPSGSTGRLFPRAWRLGRYLLRRHIRALCGEGQPAVHRHLSRLLPRRIRGAFIWILGAWVRVGHWQAFRLAAWRIPGRCRHWEPTWEPSGRTTSRVGRMSADKRLAITPGGGLIRTTLNAIQVTTDQKVKGSLCYEAGWRSA
jgi:hypothetical protein